MIAWLKTYATLIKWGVIVILLLAVFGGTFYGGYHVRDLSAQRDAIAAKQAQAQAVADALAAKAAETLANQAAGAQATQELQQTQTDTKTNFQVIYRDVVRYVQANSVPATCGLDADGLRYWNAANAGKPDATAAPSKSDTAK